MCYLFFNCIIIKLKIEMKTRQTKPYEQPAMDVVELEMRVPLCVSGYGDTTGEDPQDGGAA